MLYFFKANAELCPTLSEVIGSDQLQQIPISRYYLNSNLFLEELGESASLCGKEVEKVSEKVVQELMSEAKVILKGTVESGKTYTLCRLTSPWKVTVLVTPVEVAGLIPYKGKLPEYFYRRKIGIFGGPGSGKTCLTRELTNRLCIDFGISADNPYEYPSTFIARYGAPRFDDQVWITMKQWEREEDISRTKQITISDCPHPMCLIYAKKLAQAEKRGTDKTLPWLFEMSMKGLQSFDICVFLPFNSERCTDDGIRIHNPLESKELTDDIQRFLDESNVEYITHDGDIDSLINKILNLNG